GCHAVRSVPRRRSWFWKLPKETSMKRDYTVIVVSSAVSPLLVGSKRNSRSTPQHGPVKSRDCTGGLPTFRALSPSNSASKEHVMTRSATFLIAVAETIALPAQSRPTVQGAWRLAEVRTTGPAASSNANPQPSLYLFSAKHYSITRVTSPA